MTREDRRLERHRLVAVQDCLDNVYHPTRSFAFQRTAKIGVTALLRASLTILNQCLYNVGVDALLSAE